MNSKLKAAIGGDIQPMGPGLLTKYTRFVLIVVVGVGIECVVPHSECPQRRESPIRRCVSSSY